MKLFICAFVQNAETNNFSSQNQKIIKNGENKWYLVYSRKMNRLN